MEFLTSPVLSQETHSAMRLVVVIMSMAHISAPMNCTTSSGMRLTGSWSLWSTCESVSRESVVSTMRSRISNAVITPPLPSNEEKRSSEVGDKLLTPSDAERESSSKRERVGLMPCSLGNRVSLRLISFGGGAPLLGACPASFSC